MSVGLNWKKFIQNRLTKGVEWKSHDLLLNLLSKSTNNAVINKHCAGSLHIFGLRTPYTDLEEDVVSRPSLSHIIITDQHE